jgi:hypothetical protein
MIFTSADGHDERRKKKTSNTRLKMKNPTLEKVKIYEITITDDLTGGIHGRPNKCPIMIATTLGVITKQKCDGSMASPDIRWKFVNTYSISGVRNSK